MTNNPSAGRPHTWCAQCDGCHQTPSTIARALTRTAPRPAPDRSWLTMEEIRDRP